MPGCQVIFNLPVDETFRLLEEAARVGPDEVAVLPGDIAVAIMGPSIRAVTEVVERAVEVLLAKGRHLSCALTLSEG